MKINSYTNSFKLGLRFKASFLIASVVAVLTMTHADLSEAGRFLQTPQDFQTPPIAPTFTLFLLHNEKICFLVFIVLMFCRFTTEYRCKTVPIEPYWQNTTEARILPE